MGVREGLVLDHFYIGVTDTDFDKLIELKDIFQAVSHSKSKVQNDNWEGIYIHSRTRAYFEILRERRNGGFGICFSPYFPFYVDAMKILEDLPEENWLTGTRIWATGEKWYDWISTGNYLDTDQTFFNAWIMKYHSCHFDRKAPIPRPSVDKYNSVRLKLGKEHAEEVERLSAWFPGQRVFDGNSIRFAIQDRDGYPFDVDIELVPGNGRFEFVELEMKHCDPDRLPSGLRKDLGSFILEVDTQTVKLRKQSR